MTNTHTPILRYKRSSRLLLLIECLLLIQWEVVIIDTLLIRHVLAHNVLLIQIFNK